MRELDAKQIITADFLLVSGDVVSNLPLEPILQEHRQRRQADKNAIMTMILREAAPNHRTKYIPQPSSLAKIVLILLPDLLKRRAFS